MMRKDGDMIHERIGRVVIMGGALDVPGNTTPVAECEFMSLSHLLVLTLIQSVVNFYADPYAVKELLLSPDEKLRLPLDRVQLCTLDLTTVHELPFPAYQQYIDPAFKSASLSPSNGTTKSPLVHFTSSFLESTREIMLSFGKDAMELHDIVAVWCAMENPPLPDNQDTEMTLAPGWRALRRKFDIERCAPFSS
jgi:inosine-uridine nucleoside N-ribohydrolase